ncbi:MAG: guanylate kinase [Thermodesulfobacteriota bacterium]
MSSGNLIILSAPSGTGKTTIVGKVMPCVDAVSFSVSHTTRPPRPGEQDGVDYHFCSVEQFKSLRDDDQFLEWAEVHGNYYGTSRGAVTTMLEQGKDVLLDIDVQGARQVRAAAPEAFSIFIAPPSWPEQENRLRARGTDDDDTINLRLANAKAEMADVDDYDFVIINDELEQAAEMMRAILLAMRAMGRRDLAGLPLIIPAGE